MKNVTQQYYEAITSIGREFENEVVLTDGNHTETYNNANISIEEVFSDTETLSMGKAFTKELKLKIFDPIKTVAYKSAKIVVNSKLKVGNSYETVKMGEYYASEVTTNDDYVTLEIKAYDTMAKLQDSYVPRVSLPCSPRAVVNDIATQYNFEVTPNTGLDGTYKRFNQLMPHQYYTSYSLVGACTVTANELNPNGIGYVSIKALADIECLDVSLIPNAFSGISLIEGHKYYIRSNLTNQMPSELMLNVNENGTSTYARGDTIYTAPANTKITGAFVTLMLINGLTVTTSLQLHDLTAMYGAGNEPTINEFKTEYPLTYYPYDAGSSSREGILLEKIFEGTCAETLGYMAGLEGKNAIFGMDGKLSFRWYAENSLYGNAWNDYNGVTWNEMTQTWGDIGGSSTITREQQKENGFKLNEGTFTIGSIVSGTEDTPLTVGTGKAINFYDPYMTATLLQAFAPNVLNNTYNIGEVATFGNPMLDTGDIINVKDKQGNFKTFYCSSISWEFSGGCNSTIKSIGKEDAEIEFESPTETTVPTKKTTLQQMILHFTDLIKGAKGGIFRITDSDGDGINDGWLLSEHANLTPTTKCIVANYEGIGFSSDGGATMGDVAITHEGIVADAITTGTLTAININNGNGTFTVNSNGNMTANSGKVGCWNISSDGAGLYSDTMVGGALKRVYIQPYLSQYGEDTWLLSSQNWAVGASSTDDAPFKVTYGGKINTRGDINVFNGSTLVSWIDHTNGDVCGTRFVPTSREEMKTDIELAGNMLDLVNDTEIYKYHLKLDKENGIDKDQFGVIIGESYKHTPKEVVDYKERGVDIYNMCSILWKAVQELSAEVEDLKSQLNGVEKGDSEE